MQSNSKKIKKIEKGEKIRKDVLRNLPNNIYKLGKILDKNPATILYHLNILEKRRMVTSFKREENGRTQRIFSIIELNEERNVVKVSRQLFEIKNNEIYGYALSGNTFGISSGIKRNWVDASIWKNPLRFQENGASIEIEIPEKIMNFYQIPFNSINPTYSKKKDYIFITF